MARTDANLEHIAAWEVRMQSPSAHATTRWAPVRDAKPWRAHNQPRLADGNVETMHNKNVLHSWRT